MHLLTKHGLTDRGKKKLMVTKGEMWRKEG